MKTTINQIQKVAMETFADLKVDFEELLGISGNMRGLRKFILEILDLQAEEEKYKRVQKELANIKKNFGKSDLSAYDRKKYVAKLLYIHLMGYSFEFGFQQIQNLMVSKNYSEKQIGYAMASLYVTIDQTSNLVTMLIQHLSKEIRNHDSDAFQCLALCLAANIGGREISENLTGDIYNCLRDSRNTPNVKRAACLALCKLVRTKGDQEFFKLDQEKVDMLNNLLSNNDIGVQLSTACLVLVLIPEYPDLMKGVFPTVLTQLGRLFECAVDPSYRYGGNPAPWLVLKYMRILQYKDDWPDEDKSRILKYIDYCLSKASSSTAKGSQKELNSNMILLFEAVNLIMSRRFESDLLKRCADILCGFLDSTMHQNLRYLSIETLSRMVVIDSDVARSLNDLSHRTRLYEIIRDYDDSIRKRTISLLYSVCNRETVDEIVQELLKFLRNAATDAIKADLCIKIAIMAEVYASDPAQFVNVVIDLLTIAGDFCVDDIWYRVVQVVSTVPDLRKYATVTTFQTIKNADHGRLISLAAQLYGDYFDVSDIPPEEAFNVFKVHYDKVDDNCRGCILSCLAKVAARYPQVRQQVLDFISEQRKSPCADIHQRAVEYVYLFSRFGNQPHILLKVFRPSPPFDKKKSSLLKKVLESQEEGTDEKRVAQHAPEPPTQQDQEPAMAIPQAAPQSSSGPGLLDAILGGVNPPGAPAQPTSLIGGDSSFDTTPKTPTDGPNSLLKSLLINDSGLLYEDSNVALHVKFEFRGYFANITFCVQNKTSNLINNVSVNVVPHISLGAQMSAGSQNLQSESIFFYCRVVLRSPYTAFPQVKFVYHLSGSKNDKMLDLPLPVTKFITDFRMEQPAYFERWGSIDDSRLTVTANFPLPRGVDPTQRLHELLSLFKVSEIQMNIPAKNVCGAGALRFESELNVGILVRLYEESPGVGKAEVKVTNHSVTSAVQKVLNTYFSE